MFLYLTIISNIFNPPDSGFCPGVYVKGGMVAEIVTLNFNNSYRFEVYGCLGKYFDDSGYWRKDIDTILLLNEDTVFGKYICKNNSLIEVHKSKERMDISSPQRISDFEWIMLWDYFKCHVKYDFDNTIKAKYDYLDEKTICTGFYPNGKVEYIIEYNSKNRRTGTWYFFTKDGRIEKVIENIKEPEVKRKRKLLKRLIWHIRIQFYKIKEVLT